MSEFRMIRRAVLFSILMGLACIACLHLVPRPLAVAWVADGGVVDVVGIGFYLLAAVLYTHAAGVSGGAAARQALWTAVGVLLVLAYLEMAPAGWTLGKFSRPESTPSGDHVLKQIVAWGIPVLTGLLVLSLLVKHHRAFGRGLVRGRAIPWLILYVFGLLSASIVLDRIQGQMGWPHTGWEHYAVDRGAYFAVGTVEECIEVLIPVMFLPLLWIWKRSAPVPSSAETPGTGPGGSERD